MGNTIIKAVDEHAVQAFIATWGKVTASEISITQSFVNELCDLLDLPRRPKHWAMAQHPDLNA